MKAVIALALVILVSPIPAMGRMITVSCNEGQADFNSLRLAVMSANWGDVIVVHPCVYEVDSEWPVPLDTYAPDIIGLVPPGEVVFQGDGTRPAFMVHFNTTARVSIRNITFRGISEVLWRQEPSNPIHIEFRNNRIESCEAGLDAAGASPSSVIADNVIVGNQGAGIDVTICAGLIEDNEICGNTGDGISGASTHQCEIRGNHIHDNEGCGIAVGYFVDASDNTLEHNGLHGLRWEGQGSSLSGNVIRWNAGSGVYLDSASGSLGPFSGNDIYGNRQYDVEVSTTTGQGTADFRENWWGTTDPALIASAIRDCDDGPSVPMCVVFEPPCGGPGCPPTPVKPASWGTVKALYR